MVHETRPPQLRVTLVQRAASLEPVENLAALDRVAALTPAADLVVLPEGSARDFGEPGTDLAPYAEPLDGPYAARLAEVAGRATVVAGIFETAPDVGRPFNTLVVAGAAGPACYRKIHLYDSFGYRESDRLTAGPVAPVIVEVDGVRVGLMTCYDLRFPELARELVRRGAELLVAPSAWVAGPGKVDHWRTLVKARAIENTAFVAAVGQPGPRYTGHSMLAGPAGEVVGELADGEHLLTASVQRDRLEQARTENPSLLNRRF
jgi:predicted amidohydrolase